MGKKKDNPFSDNPFGKFDDEASDPFQDHSVPPADSGAWTGARDSAWGGASSQPATISLNNGSVANGGGNVQMDYLKRKEQLDQKERELAAREEELKKQHEELIKSGALKPKKNWPKCFPITHHDIDGEVPEPHRKMVKFCYWAFLGFFVAVTFNWFGALMAMCVINPGSGRLFGFLLATIYWFAGLPGAWILWYIRIYNLAIKERALMYAVFFLTFAAHVLFCIWSAISPPLPLTNDWSHTGFVTSIKGFDKSTFVGVLYIIGGVLWSMESLWSIWAYKTVYFHFRSGNASQRMKQEAATAVASHAISGGSKKSGKKGGNKFAEEINPPKPGSNFGAGDIV